MGALTEHKKRELTIVPTVKTDKGYEINSLYLKYTTFLLTIKVLCPSEIRYIQKVKYGIMTSSN